MHALIRQRGPGRAHFEIPGRGSPARHAHVRLRTSEASASPRKPKVWMSRRSDPSILDVACLASARGSSRAGNFTARRRMNSKSTAFRSNIFGLTHWIASIARQFLSFFPDYCAYKRRGMEVRRMKRIVGRVRSCFFRGTWLQGKRLSNFRAFRMRQLAWRRPCDFGSVASFFVVKLRFFY